jgi:hypothetical protein
MAKQQQQQQHKTLNEKQQRGENFFDPFDSYWALGELTTSILVLMKKFRKHREKRQLKLMILC